MNVPLLDLKPQFAQYKDRLMPELMQVIESQAFILGPKVEKMEKELADYIGVKYALGVSSGTDALLLALMGLGIGHGDEVITTPYTFFATAGSIHRVGARPVFVDIEPDTYNIDATKIEKAISRRTKAIMPVHLFGQCCDMDAINAIARRHGLKVIEDACQSIGAKYGDKQAGNLGDVGAFSFFPSKNLGCFGDGGLVTTNDEALYKRMKALRVHGGERQYYHAEVGMNGRLDAIQAVVVSAKLPLLAGWTEGRRRNADRYDHFFANNPKIQVPVRREGRYHIFNQYVIAVDRRDELKQHLTEKQIGCAIYYPLSLHQQECFSYLQYRQGDFPVAETAAKRTLALPIYPEIPAGGLEYVAQTINAFYR
ncbi:MAG: Pleiotropic regulatory protein [Candidatus Ozemobacter sibiricus]|uniref:Pleiotropic regulatory protein n=1 Tax=Candidatus Ozemobacter sibiricus TaxID=2268124 RepID=A0A367ZPB7_9BACT|nr:MAG: Pleiotropic regulatory protein [Candidatus Ozemobacter sibiricus]